VDEREFELTVGDVLHVGEYVVTVVDIDGTDVSFRIDDSLEQGLLSEVGQGEVSLA